LGIYQGLDNGLRKCKVLLDSSVLLQVYDGVDVISLINDELGDCEYYVLDCILTELSGIAGRSYGFRGRAATLALEYIRMYNVGVISISSHPKCSGDESIVNFLISREDLRKEFIVATNDDGLKKELLRLGIKVVTWWASKFKYVLLYP
jgi:rRNA-processing protein FCF1